MNIYRLRVELPTQPVRSTDVSDAIGEMGGSVLSVDLHEVDGTAAIDELVVELPDGLNGSAVRTALESDSKATLLSSRKCERDEAHTQARRWVHDIATLPPDSTSDVARHVAAACPLSGVWVGPAKDANPLPAVQLTLERGTPIVQRSTIVPDLLSRDERPTPRWLLAVPDRYPDARNIALLTRPLSLRFTANEVARVELLMAS